MNTASHGRKHAIPHTWIYDCTIRHVRRSPVHNEFTYRTLMWLVDLDHLPRLPRPLRVLADFRTVDHVGAPELSLRGNIDAYLAEHGIDLGGGRVRMLAAARSFGHVFNPLTVYWCHAADGRLACVVAEVHNTYGGRHRYLLHPDEAGRAETDKEFYVSPFFPVNGSYRMSLPEPAEDLAVSIRYQPPGAAPFTAVLQGRRSSPTPSALLVHAFRQPCPTLLAAARIRMQGTRLYLKGLPVVPRNVASKPAITPQAARLSTGTPPRRPIAAYLARLYRALTGAPELPIGVQAWDGSRSGPEGGPALVLSSPRALRRLVWAPNELGLAQAYVTGELDVHGDVAEGLRRIWASAATDARAPHMTTPGNAARLLTAAIRLNALGPRPAAPASQAHVHGRLHTLARDRAVISHHYDLSNDFYALLLDESMAYSSAYWSSAEPDYTLTDAQRDKFDSICRKLELVPGMRLLDVGCGWGGLLMHAAEHYGIHGLGLTISRQQAAYITRQLALRGLQGRITVRVQHFREFAEPQAFDAAASIEMGEHVGAEAYPAYTRMVHTALKPGGRALIQQMSRSRTAAPGGGPFIESFIAPDMHMRPREDTVEQWQSAGFAVRGTESLRAHYVRTIEAWRRALEDGWAEAVELIGEERARVWRLYLAGGQVAFEQGRMGVDQFLLQKADDVGY